MRRGVPAVGLLGAVALLIPPDMSGVVCYREEIMNATQDSGSDYELRRIDCLRELADLVDGELVISNVSRTSFEWHDVKHRDGNLYTMGMGLVTPVAFGLALACPDQRVVALDGDGSILLNLGALATLGNHPAPNLVSIIFDNEAYTGTGGLPTASRGATDIAAVAQAAGIAKAVTVRSVVEFRSAAEKALTEPGPSIIVAKVKSEMPEVGPKLMDGRENKYRFVRHIEQITGRTILKPSIVARSEAAR